MLCCSVSRYCSTRKTYTKNPKLSVTIRLNLPGCENTAENLKITCKVPELPFALDSDKLTVGRIHVLCHQLHSLLERVHETGGGIILLVKLSDPPMQVLHCCRLVASWAVHARVQAMRPWAQISVRSYQNVPWGSWAVMYLEGRVSGSAKTKPNSWRYFIYDSDT